MQGDAAATQNALADLLEGQMQVDTALVADVQAARAKAALSVDDALRPYLALKNAVEKQVGPSIWWVRDITLSNSMWGNRAPRLNHPRAGVHALGGGIGQGLAMAIGVAIADNEHRLQRKTVVLAGDGGFMLNVGKLACAGQERANLVVLLMNDSCYGVIKNIQDDLYGSRHCYVDLHTPDFALFCASLGVTHFQLKEPAQTVDVLAQAFAASGTVVVEVDMQTWGAVCRQVCWPDSEKGLTCVERGAHWLRCDWPSDLPQAAGQRVDCCHPCGGARGAGG